MPPWERDQRNRGVGGAERGRAAEIEAAGIALRAGCGHRPGQGDRARTRLRQGRQRRRRTDRAAQRDRAGPIA